MRLVIYTLAQDLMVASNRVEDPRILKRVEAMDIKVCRTVAMLTAVSKVTR